MSEYPSRTECGWCRKLERNERIVMSTANVPVCQDCRDSDEVDDLRAENARLREALEGFLSLVNESEGVYGLHLNGNVAPWSEFEDPDIARAALAPTEADDE